MVQGFVSRMGGCLRIASELGVGTVVEIVLPRARIDDGDMPDRDHASPDPGLHGDATLLLVDADEQFRRVTATFLRELGYVVLEANNAETAVALVHTLRRLDLLITDQLMPGVSGATLMSRLRTDWPGLPVQFLIGGEPGPELVGEAVLSKPFSFSALATAVLERLGRWTPQDSRGDRLLARLQTPALRQLYLIWHASKAPGELMPRLSGIDPLRFGLGPHAFIVEVETMDPAKFRFTTVGSALTQRLGRPLDGLAIDVVSRDDDMLGDMYSTYRRCARNLAPVYQAARFNFGDGLPLHLERIVLPVSENTRTITHLVGLALFTEPGGQDPMDS
jgi:CheY-like chemotaxis protein